MGARNVRTGDGAAEASLAKSLLLEEFCVQGACAEVLTRLQHKSSDLTSAAGRAGLMLGITAPSGAPLLPHSCVPGRRLLLLRQITVVVGAGASGAPASPAAQAACGIDPQIQLYESTPCLCCPFCCAYTFTCCLHYTSCTGCAPCWPHRKCLHLACMRSVCGPTGLPAASIQQMSSLDSMQ